MPDSRAHDVAALLFDNDGVLVDSDVSSLEAWRLWSLEHGLDPEDVLPVVHGRRAADTVADLLGAGQVRATQRIHELELATTDQVTALPGALALLGSLGSLPWAVVTSATTPLARARLTAAGLPVPDVLVTADDVERGKPEPDCWLEAARRLGVDPAACVVFEDSDAGVRAGLASGARVVGVNRRSDEQPTWAAVPDLSHVSATAAATGVRLQIAAP